MRCPFLLALAIALLGACGICRGADDVKEELKKLQGTWLITAQEEGGKNVLDTSGPPKLAIDAEKLRLKLRGHEGSYSYKLNPAASPKEIDLTALDGSAKGDVVPAIYLLDGDELWVCFGRATKPRPDAFATRGTVARTLFKCKREKPPDEATAKEIKKLVGTWVAVSAEVDGVALPEKTVKSIKYVITEGKIVIPAPKNGGPGAALFTETTRTYELNVTAKPKAIDMQDWRGEFPGATFCGIYQLDGDELTICHRYANEKERPTAFETKPKSKTMLIKLKREKP
jgi:uncharacterized protein (TIGR03067 family)